jgi:hypothetical protein
MRTRNLVAFLTLAALICSFFTVSQVIAARKTADFEDQVRALEFSKAVPGQLNYQGYLVDATDSSAVTATLEMTFRLYDTETKGAELWSETHPAVEVSNGLFQVLLGSVTPFPDGLFDGSDMWLQTEIGAEVLSPRKPLVSVAYSHRANSAEMLEDNTLTDLDDRWVNEGQANSVTSDMVVDGAGSGLDADMVDGQHAADFIGADDLNHLDAADGDPANAVYVDLVGEVGIGTTAPARNVHIYDDSDGIVGIEIENPSTGSNSIEMVTFTDENGGVAGIATYDDGSSYPSAMRVYNNRPNGTLGLVVGTERVRINNDGKVGIGTSTPSYTLDVNGAVNASTYWGDGSNLTGIAGAPDADWTISGSDMYSGVSGNVGIGTSSPGYPLHVYRYAGYSPAYAGYFHAVGHEATGNAYAVYANAQADDENAYGIYSTAASTWGQAYAGYFDGNVHVNGEVRADTVFLGSSTKAGTDGWVELYRDGSADAIVEFGDKWDDGGMMWFRNDGGYTHIKMETDVHGGGAWCSLQRGDALSGLTFDGNYSGTEEPRLLITGSARAATFHMDQSGDNSVNLPANAISAPEIYDEPGVSNSLGTGFFYLDGGNIDYTVDTVDINIPDAGYVEVTAGCYLNLWHAKGVDTEVWLSIDEIAGNVNYSYPGAQIAHIPAYIDSGWWAIPQTTTRLYEESSAGARRYFLNVKNYSGINPITNIARSYMRAKYYPTLYGTVTLAETEGFEDTPAASQVPGDGREHAPEPRRRSITTEDHNARIEAKLQALQAELEALKEQVQNQNRK